ncbi:MAG TPA: multiheme c-type cytochrome [Acidobacteriaceae bacterium]
MNLPSPTQTARALYRGCALLAVALASALCLHFTHIPNVSAQQNQPTPHRTLNPRNESPQQAAAASTGCITCHVGIEHPNMHAEDTVVLGCADCHGGNASIQIAGTKDSAEYNAAKKKAHVYSRFASDAVRGGHPVRAYTRWLEESYDYIRFANPGDLRVANETCGGCHAEETRNVKNSMMTHGAMLWSAALYNNGAYPLKNPHFGEAYDADGKPVRLRTFPPPTAEETRAKGVLPYLDPLQRWEYSQPGNMLRAFERDGEKRSEIGNPDREELPGKPDTKLSDRGLGTGLRTDPVFLGLQKTRLLDPLLSMPGTNDQAGDYRGSGCSGCHVLYANDRDPQHSAALAQFGNMGRSVSADVAINKSESGHPLQHGFTKMIPSSQCMTCHIHPGTNMVTTYYGFTWWDNEADGDKMYPAKQHNPTEQELHDSRVRNPDESAARGNWSNPDFLEQTGTPEFNKGLKDTQFADFHSHGWIFRKVYKRDRKGNLLDANDNLIPNDDPDALGKAVHLADIHLEKGMHCVDCHFTQDVHGNGKLYGETRNAIEIGCVDCHGTIEHKALLTTSGPASARDLSSNMLRMRTPWKQARFVWRDGKLFQRSNVDEHKEWEIVQVLDTITPGNAHFSEKSRLAKTLQVDGVTWGHTDAMQKLAHSDKRMTCQSCHSSWTTSCFGCHLSMTANQKMPMLHNEGETTRNWTAYNFQVLRDDVYMLGIDGTVTGNKVSPVRSSCAIIVSSQNANRDWIYHEQQPVSAPGFSGEAFSTYVPHTVRGRETKGCTDCHVATAGDNNAWMSQLLVEGTNFLNFMGKYIYVANGSKGFSAVPVAASTEPPVIAGSDFQKLAYPDDYKKFVAGGRQIRTAYEHGGDEVLDVQLRGEYLYAAMGAGGFRIFDVANVDVKDNSERVTTAPVSPLGQKFYLKTKFATAVASPSTLALDPLRKQIAENEEQRIHPLYAYLYVTDKYEGLIVVGDPKTGVGTLLDGNPRNNFLRRATTFNPGGILNGAHRIALAGARAFILCDRGLVEVDLNDPLHPKIVAEDATIRQGTGLAVQFRYLFVTDADGLKVIDITKPGALRRTDASLPIADARNVYVARTYAYISAGHSGIAIVDVEKPEQPKLNQMFNAGGALNDVNDLKIGMVSSSQFAFVADGKNGMRIVQLFSPGTQRNFYGFSPEPVPVLIATRKTSGPALAISKGVDRDRAADEDGNQLAVFGRRGARPFNGEEMRRMYLRTGELYTVTENPPAPPSASARKATANR